MIYLRFYLLTLVSSQGNLINYSPIVIWRIYTTHLEININGKLLIYVISLFVFI
jgi:hypothetical protein